MLFDGMVPLERSLAPRQYPNDFQKYAFAISKSHLKAIAKIIMKASTEYYMIYHKQHLAHEPRHERIHLRLYTTTANIRMHCTQTHEHTNAGVPVSIINKTKYENDDGFYTAH